MIEKTRKRKESRARYGSQDERGKREPADRGPREIKSDERPERIARSGSP